MPGGRAISSWWPQLQVFLGTNQVIAAAGYTIVEVDQVPVDTHDGWDAGGFFYRIPIGGLWLATYGAGFGSAETSGHVALVRVTGTPSVASSRLGTPQERIAVGAGGRLSGGTFSFLAAGDKVGLGVNTAAGNTLLANLTQISLVRLGA